MICEDETAPAILDALHRAHPYEEPAFDFCRILTAVDVTG